MPTCKLLDQEPNDLIQVLSDTILSQLWDYTFWNICSLQLLESRILPRKGLHCESDRAAQFALNAGKKSKSHILPFCVFFLKCDDLPLTVILF